MIQYTVPDSWVKYDRVAIATPIIAAKSAVLSLQSIPYQRSWAERLQEVQLKREVAGTSRIEGADFTEKELEDAMAEDAEELVSRSQRQAAAAVKTYRWIANLPDDRPIDENLILGIHRSIVIGADDCPPGQLRGPDENVTFGAPRHRGVPGGQDCALAFRRYCEALNRDMRDHDPLIHALAAHYHFAAMHPFLDGNGRTARALEALYLQRCGLRDSLFIAMSNYYYEEKSAYLKALADVRAIDHDLTPFLVFGLRGIEIQCKRLLAEIRVNMQKVLFRDQMYSLFNKLTSPRKRVIAKRQIHILTLLLERDMTLQELIAASAGHYASLKNQLKALIRDIRGLLHLRAITIREEEEAIYRVSIRLEWPTEITETEFFDLVRAMPTAKTYRFLDHWEN